MNLKLSPRLRARAGTVCAVAVLLTASACSTSASKGYDIGPLFPLTTNKCQKYNGTTTGSGLMATCMVTKSDCDRAAADWAAAMKNVPDAMLYKCVPAGGH